MKKRAFKYLSLGLIMAIELMPAIALAANKIPDLKIDPEAVTDLMNLIKTWVSQVIFILGILMVLYAAFLYMTSAGDDTKIEKAKKTLIYGIVGIIVAMLAYFIWETVASFLGA